MTTDVEILLNMLLSYIAIFTGWIIDRNYAKYSERLRIANKLLSMSDLESDDERRELMVKLADLIGDNKL